MKRVKAVRVKKPKIGGERRQGAGLLTSPSGICPSGILRPDGELLSLRHENVRDP